MYESIKRKETSRAPFSIGTIVVDYAKGALSGSWGDVWGQAGTK